MEVFSLYHHHERLKGLPAQVLQDLGQCGQVLQTELSFAAPLLSTVTGEPLSFSARPLLREVAEAILDMVFLQAVNWVGVQESIARLAKNAIEGSGGGPVSILNYGPGLGVSRISSLGEQVKIMDISRLEDPAYTSLSENDIAIVGMAVELPGAPDADTLWQRLMDGADSCTEVRRRVSPVPKLLLLFTLVNLFAHASFVFSKSMVLILMVACTDSDVPF